MMSFVEQKNLPLTNLVCSNGRYLLRGILSKKGNTENYEKKNLDMASFFSLKHASHKY
jgi:hypothetical protein